MSAVRLIFIASLTLSIVLLVGCKQQSFDESQLKPAKDTKVQPTSVLFEINGIKASADPALVAEYMNALKNAFKSGATKQSFLAGSGGPNFFDLTIYSFISCQADWDQTCEGDYVFTSPVGTQMCKLYYTVSSNNSTSVSQTPSGWYTGDTERPPRFRTYGLHVFAGGDHNFLTRKGSNIYLANVGMRVIPSGANDLERYATGCDMPPH
jgi:hypothetical protein